MPTPFPTIQWQRGSFTPIIWGSPAVCAGHDGIPAMDYFVLLNALEWPQKLGTEPIPKLLDPDFVLLQQREQRAPVLVDRAGGVGDIAMMHRQ